MHPSSKLNMQKAIDSLFPPGSLALLDSLDIVDVGGRNIKPGQDRSYKHMFGAMCRNYYIADIAEGPNVTHQMLEQYTIPFDDNTIDLVVSGQTLEHVKNPFRLVADMRRILKPGGNMILIAPSAGKRHDTIDCWRFMDDGFKAIAEECEIEVLYDHVDRTAPDERSARWADHIFIGRKPT
jgi:SAM-dependent methyltransferase